jgi:hypothetical protein
MTSAPGPRILRTGGAQVLVGDTGIEPVTSSVSRNDHDIPIQCYSHAKQGRRSTEVHGCPAPWIPVVTQLDTHTARTGALDDR